MIHIEQIVNIIVTQLKNRLSVPVEASGRHVHLSRADADRLFGRDYVFEIAKDLSQPGQYACKERVDVSGPKGAFKNVAILGPCRGDTQIEISQTDARTLGLSAPVRLSGSTDGTPGCTLTGPKGSIDVPQGVIVAKRHIHLTPHDAARFHVTDGEALKLKVFGDRPLIFEDLIARISDKFATAVHIDYDEANACGLQSGAVGMIIK